MMAARMYCPGAPLRSHLPCVLESNRVVLHSQPGLASRKHAVRYSSTDSRKTARVAKVKSWRAPSGGSSTLRRLGHQSRASSACNRTCGGRAILEYIEGNGSVVFVFLLSGDMLRASSRGSYWAWAMLVTMSLMWPPELRKPRARGHSRRGQDRQSECLRKCDRHGHKQRLTDS